jgi:hypothetical protein
MYSLMTVISIETGKQLVKSTSSIHSLRQGVVNQNHDLRYPQDTRINTVTVTTDSLVLTQLRTNHLVLDQLVSIPNNDSPPIWPCPTTHYPDGLSWCILPCGWIHFPSPTG